MDEEEVKWVIGEEERIRHDALFYSQKPRDGFLSGTRYQIINNHVYYLSYLATTLFQ